MAVTVTIQKAKMIAEKVTATSAVRKEPPKSQVPQPKAGVKSSMSTISVFPRVFVPLVKVIRLRLHLLRRLHHRLRQRRLQLRSRRCRQHSLLLLRVRVVEAIWCLDVDLQGFIHSGHGDGWLSCVGWSCAGRRDRGLSLFLFQFL